MYSHYVTHMSKERQIKTASSALLQNMTGVKVKNILFDFTNFVFLKIITKLQKKIFIFKIAKDQ